MKPLTTLTKKILLLILLILLQPYVSAAQPAIVGGEITYKHIEDSLYSFYFTGYFQCSAVSETSTVGICARNTCNTYATTIILNKISTDTIFSTCPSKANTCTSPTATIPGYKKVVYHTQMRLPFKCNYWIFSYAYTPQVVAVNLSANTMYFETKLNNTGSFQANSSPTFPIPAIQITCANVLTHYTNTAYDVNNDSITIKQDTVKSGSCTTALPVPFVTKIPMLTVVFNPFQTNNTFTCIPLTGYTSYKPVDTGSNIFSQLINEYRNGIWIGSVKRNICVNNNNCNNATINMKGPVNVTNCTSINSSIIGNAMRIQACLNNSYSFSISAVSADPSAILVVSANDSLLPGAVMSYQNQRTDSVRINFYMPFNFMKTGVQNLILQIRDSSCKTTGIVTTQYHTIQITTWDKPYIGPDTTICHGKQIILKSAGPYTYADANVWTVLPGGHINSISCDTCINTTASPLYNTTYICTRKFCPTFADTMSVTVTTRKTPLISITANPGTYITTGTPVTFKANVTGCINALLRWRINGGSTLGVDTIFTPNTLLMGDRVTCDLICRDSCLTTAAGFSNILKMYVYGTGIAQIPESKNFSIYPNPSNGIFNIYTPETTTNNFTVQVINMLGTVVYKNKLKDNKQIVSVNLSKYPDGIYTLLINDVPYMITIAK